MNINEAARRLETLLDNDRPEPVTPRSTSPTPRSRSPITPKHPPKKPQTWNTWFSEIFGSSTSSRELYSQYDTLRMTRDIESLHNLSHLLLLVWPYCLEADDVFPEPTLPTEEPILSSSIEEETNFQPVGPGVWAPQVSESNILTWRGKEQVQIFIKD